VPESSLYNFTLLSGNLIPTYAVNKLYIVNVFVEQSILIFKVSSIFFWEKEIVLILLKVSFSNIYPVLKLESARNSMAYAIMYEGGILILNSQLFAFPHSLIAVKPN